MALRCILSKTAVVFSTPILYSNLYATGLPTPFCLDTKGHVPNTTGALFYTWTVCYTLTAYSPCTHLNALFCK